MRLHFSASRFFPPMFLTACVISAFRSNAPDRHDQRASAIEEDDSPGRIDFTGREWREIAAPYPLIQHTSTPLNDGTVVVAGGVSLVNTEELTSDASYVFDPFTGSWSLPFSMNQRRAGHVTIGRGWEAITVGGLSRDGETSSFRADAESYYTGGTAWYPGPQLTLSTERARFTATDLDGTLLVVGGYNSTGLLASAETLLPKLTVASLPEPRIAHTAVRLTDGSVVVTGGFDADDEVTDTNYVLPNLYQSWEFGAELATARAYHTATLLSDGRVLFVGGQDASSQPLASVEYLVTSTGGGAVTMSLSTGVGEAAPLLEARTNHTAGILPDGRVLVVGGRGTDGLLKTTELYDPTTDTWSSGPPLKVARADHTMVVLDARVIVFGGIGASEQTLASVEVLEYGKENGEACEDHGECLSGTCIDGVCCDTWCQEACMACSAALKGYGDDGVCEPVADSTDPQSDCGNGLVCQSGECGFPTPCPHCDDLGGATWRKVDAPDPLYGFAAAALDDGRVLVTGGSSDGQSTIAFLPDTESWETLPQMNTARWGHSATKLLDGRVLVVGGPGWTSEVFDPVSSSWTEIEDQLAEDGRQYHTATVDPDGKVIVIGGGSTGYSSSIEVFDPSVGPNGAWVGNYSLDESRLSHTATLLPNGSIFVAGGNLYGEYSTATTLVLEPPYDTPVPSNPLYEGRVNHTATLLDDGRVLIAGGEGYYDLVDSTELIDPTATEYSTQAGPLLIPRAYHTAATLPDGRVIVVGGVDENGLTATTEIYDPTTNEWKFGPSLNVARAWHRMVVLPNRIIVIGGMGEYENSLDNVEILDLGGGTGGKGLGSTCAADGECVSGHCVDGVCCDTACEGACVACTAALKGSGNDGVCGTVVDGTNPRSECAGDAVCQAGECVTPVAACSEDGTLCAEGDGCTIGICRDGACIDTYRLDGTRCEGGICIAGKCRLDPTPASDEEVGFDGGIGSGDGTSNGGTNGSSSASEDAEDGGGCSIGGRAHGSSPIATGLALLAAIGLMRRRGEKTHSHVDRG